MTNLAQLEAQSPALLILAYLCHNCHVNTARAFATELRRTMPGGGTPGATPGTGGHMTTGFESGYGTRPIDRDTLTGAAAFAPRVASSEASIPSPVVVGTPIEGTAPATARSPSAVPSVAQLKDSDGDDIMSPPPHEGNEDGTPVSFGHILAEPDDVEILMLDHTDVPLEDVPLIIQPEDIRPEPIREVDSIETLIKKFDDVAFLEEVTRRKTIKDNILWGRIKDATAMLEEHFPDVLHGMNPSPSSVPAPATIAMGRQPSNTVSNTSPVFVYPVSLAPAHVNLNLRIQSFIEAVRTRPLAPPPRPASHLTPHHALSLSPYYSPASSPSPPAIGSFSGAARSQHDQSLVLHLGKELVQIVNSLPDPRDRAIFLKELDGIWALMAYPEPEAKSPANVSKYLQYIRRVELADQINGAILQRAGHNPRPVLEQYVRSTGAVWNSINENDVQIPADPQRYPPGVVPPPLGRPPMRIFPSAPSGDTVPGPPFDFARFMDD